MGLFQGGDPYHDTKVFYLTSHEAAQQLDP